MGLAGGDVLKIKGITELNINEFLMALAYNSDQNYTEKQTRK